MKKRIFIKHLIEKVLRTFYPLQREVRADEKNIPASIYQKIGEILIIFTKAVRKAQEENRKLGLPNVYCEEGRIYYQLPDGRITTKASI